MPRSDTTQVAPRRSAPATDTERINTVIDGRYRLEALLGRGGMGVVYRAAHLKLRKSVAIKVLHPSLATSPDVRSRFEREALAIGKIEHPNCVGVFDVGTMEDDGALYLVMELLDGKSLGDVLDEEGQLAPTRALHILRHILQGLGHVHHARLVHRDIKPENIYLVTHGDDRDFAKILDFGIAKPMTASDLDDGVKLTQAGVAFGTPIYMSPEQALGNPVDGRADLYSASALAFEMLTGQPPFYSDDKLEVMSMHTTRPVPRMEARLIKGGTPVSEEIEAVIAKGLAKRPEDRYQNAEEYLAALNALMEVGGATEVEIRPTRRITGSQPLAVSADGAVTVQNTRPSAARPLALPGVAPLPGDPPSPATTGVLVRPPMRRPMAPAPPLDLSPSRRPWWVYLAAAILAAAFGMATFTMWRPRAQSLEAKGPVATAAEANRNGKPAIALAILEPQGEALANDALGQLELGHARAASNRALSALDAYARALELAPELASGTFVRSHLKTMSDDPAKDNEGQEVVGRAFAMLLERFDLPDTESRLLAAAQDPKATWRRRKAAQLVADHFRLADKLDRFVVASLDLTQGEGCEVRRAAIASLRALGDARAIALLEPIVAKYGSESDHSKKPRRGKKPRSKNREDYACLVEDAEAALVFLRDLQLQKGSPAEGEVVLEPEPAPAAAEPR